jgi:hypothetical protein
MFDKDWRPVKRANGVVPRGSYPTPCGTCPKAKTGPGAPRPNPGADMKGRVAGAYHLFLAVKAGAPMPDDPIVVANCALLQEVTGRHERAQREVLPTLLALMASGPGGR